MLTLETCEKKTLCVDCKDKSCMHAGQAIADCPKYKCDNSKLHDCENCLFLAAFIKSRRKQYTHTPE